MLNSFMYYKPLRPPFTDLTECPKDADPTATFEAGAKKEIEYLTKFGQPLHPFQRLRREIYDYQK
jgi:hypothetical protein